jgi:hypothetical protein
VAASVSDDLIHWQEVGPVYVRQAWDEDPTRALESPCVVYKDDRYFLFFKHGWGTHFVVSQTPWDFRQHASYQLGACHAAEIFQWQGQWWVTHCSGDPDDYLYRESNRTRGLFMGHLEWPTGEHPRLI